MNTVETLLIIVLGCMVVIPVAMNLYKKYKDDGKLSPQDIDDVLADARTRIVKFLLTEMDVEDLRKAKGDKAAINSLKGDLLVKLADNDALTEDEKTLIKRKMDKVLEESVNEAVKKAE